MGFFLPLRERERENERSDETTISMALFLNARLGTVLSNEVQISRGLLQGAPESPVISTEIMELVLRDLVKSWNARDPAWEFGRLRASCDLIRRRCGSGSSVNGTDCGCREKHIGQAKDGGLEYWGRKVCLDGHARLSIAHRSAQANKWLAKWRALLSSSWLPRKLRLNIVMPGFSVEFERVDDSERSKRQEFELECENCGRRDWCEAPRLDGNGPVVETLAQNWIEKCNMNLLG